jgi:transcription elongation GreA/GreB family factor
MDKKSVHQLCLTVINQRIAECVDNLASIDESTSNEGKSTAGDKFETGIEMLQQEFERVEMQMKHLRKLRDELSSINSAHVRDTVTLGALVTTNLGIYYVATGIGKVILDKTSIYVLSPESPMVQSLWGKKVEDKATVNGREVMIQAIS